MASSSSRAICSGHQSAPLLDLVDTAARLGRANGQRRGAMLAIELHIDELVMISIGIDGPMQAA